MPPTLSIITVNLNNLEGLKKTMQSVFEQTFTDYEYIIIDGGSTDGSKEYIEQHADKLAYWVSEKDGGIYAGINKGIRVSSGIYLMFLNSGDYITGSDMLKSAFSFVDNNPADIYYGDMQIKQNNEITVKKHPPELTIEYLRNNTINHQSSFIKRGVFQQLGIYDPKYRVAADHAFYFKALVRGFGFRHINLAIVHYDLNGITSERWELYSNEMERIAEEMDPTIIQKLKEENSYQKNLLQHRLVKIAIKLDAAYQSFRKRLKKR